MNARKSEWTAPDACDKDVQRLAELAAETNTPRLIPLPHFKSLVFGLRPEDDSEWHGQLRSLERTSDQGMPESGFSRCSAQRLSSSARSASVS